MYKSLNKNTIPKKSFPKKSLYKNRYSKYINQKSHLVNEIKDNQLHRVIKLITSTTKTTHFNKKINTNKNENLLIKFFKNKSTLISSTFIVLIFLSLFISLNNPINSDLNSLSSQNNTSTNEIITTPTNLIESNVSKIKSTTTSTTTSLPVHEKVNISTVSINNIEDAQTQLKILFIYQGKIDGVNGTFTKLSIKEFQRRSGLTVDGILGPKTKAALSRGKESYTNSKQEETNDTKQYEITDETKNLQNKLNNLNIYTGDIDGIFGYQTMISLKEFQRKAGLTIDGIYGAKTKASLDKGKEAFVKVVITNTTSEESIPIKVISNTNLTVDLQNYNPNGDCLTGYVNDLNIWVPDPCFLPVFVFRYGNVAQVNSKAELDAYLNQNWTLTKEKTYTSLGKVPTQNYTDGYNSPINGLPMPSGSNNSIVIGIKNDNNVRARPQSGPQSADAVVEVLVEGGMTRFINIFYQSDTDYHGPIRSARPTDPTVLRPVGGVLVASGATGGLIPEIVDMGVPVITDRRPEYFRISSRNAPHNLYADTAKLKQLAVNRGYKKYTNPQPLFPWGNPSQSNWSINSYLTLTFSSYTNTTWRWNGSSYVRTYYDAYKNSSSDNLHYWIDKNSNQGQITTTTVIALFCEPYTHPLQLPSVKTVGEGRAIILHNGKMLDARWKRGSNLDPFHIVDKSGNILYVPKGKVWISLVPNTKNPSFG